MRNRQCHGFTLIETLIVVVILAITATLAWPSYLEQVRKTRRSEGMGALVELAGRMEHYYTDQGTYAGATLGAATTNIFPSITARGHYTLRIDSQSSLGFSISAIPTRSAGQHLDHCNTFILDSLGNRKLLGNTLPFKQCWR